MEHTDVVPLGGGELETTEEVLEAGQRAVHVRRVTCWKATAPEPQNREGGG